MSLLATSRWRFNRHLNDVYIKRLCHIGSLVSSESCWNGLGSRKSVVEMSTMTLLSTSSQWLPSLRRFVVSGVAVAGTSFKFTRTWAAKMFYYYYSKFISFRIHEWSSLEAVAVVEVVVEEGFWARTKKHLSWTTEKDKLRGMIGDSDKEDEKLSGSGRCRDREGDRIGVHKKTKRQEL